MPYFIFIFDFYIIEEMKKDNIFKKYISLFITFFKIGLFTFGGGYAMIPLIQREASEKRGWVSPNEILDIIAIAESTPGPIAVNAATYVGFKVGKFWGSLFATIGLVLPSFGIILVISFFYKEFMALTWINAIFKGLRVGVVILLARAFLKLKKTCKLSVFTWIIFFIVLGINLALAFLNIEFNFTSIIMIAAGLILGVIATKVSKGEWE